MYSRAQLEQADRDLCEPVQTPAQPPPAREKPRGRRFTIMAGADEPPTLTKQTADAIADLLKLGNYFETAAAATGVRPGQARRWRVAGRRNGTELERYFADVCDQATAEAEAASVGRIYNAGHMGDWRADLARLERMNPERYGPKVTIAVRNELQAFWAHMERCFATDPTILERIADALATFDSPGMEGETPSITNRLSEGPAEVAGAARLDPDGDAALAEPAAFATVNLAPADLASEADR